jgi:hypothetical protein
MVPTCFSLRAFGDRSDQGIRGRPRLARVVADVSDFGAARAAPQDDFGAIADQHLGETLPPKCSIVVSNPLADLGGGGGDKRALRLRPLKGMFILEASINCVLAAAAEEWQRSLVCAATTGPDYRPQSATWL